MCWQYKIHVMTEGECHCIRYEINQPYLVERRSVTELRVVCTVA